MRTQILYILWDEQDGYRINKLYLDKVSAEIGLHEIYTYFWINNGKAKIEEIEAVTYKEVIGE